MMNDGPRCTCTRSLDGDRVLIPDPWCRALFHTLDPDPVNCGKCGRTKYIETSTGSVVCVACTDPPQGSAMISLSTLTHGEISEKS